MQVKDTADRRSPKKSWGWEEWIVNNEKYCGKRLHFTVASGCTSLHYHALKHETMYVEKGFFLILVIDPSTAEQRMLELREGQSVEIPPNTPHRIIANDAGSVLIEFSTTHYDSDSYRVLR